MRNGTYLFLMFALLVILPFPGCTQDDYSEGAAPSDDYSIDDDDDNDDSEQESKYCKVENRYEELFCTIYERLFVGSVIVDDNDVEDYGDSMAYCSALIFTLDMHGQADAIELAFAQTLVEGYKRQMDRFAANPFSIVLDSNLAMEAYIGVLGLLVGYEATGNPEFLIYIDLYFDTILELTDTLGTLIYYIPIPPYGPTTIKAGIAGTLLHYPFATGGRGQSAKRFEQGIATLAEMDVMTWDDQIPGYRYMTWDHHAYAYQYSNVTAIQALIRAYTLTDDESYLQRAEQVADGLELLYSEQYKGYLASDESFEQAPHSAEQYIALSGQNYTIFAQLLLYQATGKDVYLERALGLFEFISDTLWVGQEQLCYHDIQHGKLADWYCTGCNWQLLYNLLLLDHVQKNIDLLPPPPPLPSG